MKTSKTKKIVARWHGDTKASLSGHTMTLDGVSFHRHSNGGGWVADTAKVANTAFVGLFARVYGNAEVFGNAWVSK